MEFYRSLFTAAWFATVSAGCMSTGDLVVDGKAVADIEISPDKDAMTMGSAVQFHAVLRYADGKIKDVTNDPETVWTTSDPSIATVSKSGLVTALRNGIVDISADYKGEKANEHLAVMR